MKKSYLVSVLKTLSKKEIREMRKWLASPSHNQREDVCLLFEYLVKGKHLKEEKYLEKTRIFGRLFPKQQHKDAKMRQTIYFLTKSLEEFLIYQELLTDKARSQIALARVYRKRKLDRPFLKTIKVIDTIQKELLHRDSHFHRNEYLIQQEKYTYMEAKKHIVAMNLQEISDALDITFIADKLRQSCLMLAHQAVYKANYEINLLNAILNLIEQKKLLDIPAIAIYYFIYKATTNFDDETYFQNLKQQINKFQNLFPKPELKDIILMAINYCIKKMNAGNTFFIKETFDLYKQALKQNILIENNILSRFTYLNIVINGTYLKDFEWVENFIHKYEKYLEERFRHSIVHYSLAKLNFEKGDYNKAMRLFAQVDYNDILIYLSAKSMLIKMYYELDEIDALESLLESTRTYIQRKEVMGYHRENYKNIITYTRKLLRTNLYDKTAKAKLKKEISAIKPLTEKKWLLEQLEKRH